MKEIWKLRFFHEFFSYIYELAKQAYIYIHCRRQTLHSYLGYSGAELSTWRALKVFLENVKLSEQLISKDAMGAKSWNSFSHLQLHVRQ